ncbi:oligosaccharide flippase family protein [Erythrobacter sp.]|jgi:O-antigen/teichoic acid export membrane protein|uniref:oligosaccharide flippase family protein n=1 Tax=Erythrobacter sp. TaxID=1042 RepID=UPI002EC9E04B|nr:oligosaccharide flippase family protein [Erythrobacter sp.]
MANVAKPSLIERLTSEDGIGARVVRSSASIALGNGASQALRLVSNLILSRILFPEAFGLMALVTVFITGLQMLSDAGTSPSIMRHERGDNSRFLNTAWSIQVLRGVFLCLVTIAIAPLVAALYDEPLLAQLLPVAGFSLLITGLTPTRYETYLRHLRAVRVTVLDLVSQAINIAAVVVLAWWLQSVWALVFGTILGAAARVTVLHAFLDGHVDQFRINREDAAEIITFGRWIFLSSISGFIVLQGDKAILGAYLSLAALGIYNIGYFMGIFAAQLTDAVQAKVLIPLYRETSVATSNYDVPVVRRLRLLLSGAGLALLGLFALGGTVIIEVLYDPRYASAGLIVVLIACAQMMGLASKVYDQAALAYGDSRGFFIVVAARAMVQTTLLWVGAEIFGVAGALVGQGLALLAAHVGSIILARKHNCWDPLHDCLIIGGAFALSAGAVFVHRDSLIAFLASGV